MLYVLSVGGSLAQAEARWDLVLQHHAATQIQSAIRMKLGRDEVGFVGECFVFLFLLCCRVGCCSLDIRLSCSFLLFLRDWCSTLRRRPGRRGCPGRRRHQAQALLEIKEYLREVQERNSAATRIQSAARRRAAINQVGEIKERESAAVQIQSAARVKISRNAVQGIRMDKAAVVVQSQVRSHLAKGRIKVQYD